MSRPHPGESPPGLLALPFHAMRRALRSGYGAADLRADALAGIVVGCVALPLSMALAIASGVPPQHGLYTAIVGGLVIALLGGSRVQVSGPTAAFVVVLAPVASRYGIGGLLLATVMAGVILVILGAVRLGRLIQFVPYPVTTGFTAGIAVVIATLQVPDLLGLDVTGIHEAFPSRAAAILRALPTFHCGDLAIGAGTLALLLACPRFLPRVPAPVVALPVAALAALALAHAMPAAAPVTLAGRFSFTDATGVHPGIPRVPPLPLLPWSLGGAGGAPLRVDMTLLRELWPSALAIAVLGAIESLLSAVVADGMTGRRHDPDAELMAQGAGNLIAPFFGGIAATGAIARTATNVRSGARSPVAAVVHSLFVLAAVMCLAPVLGSLPMASLAALLLVVAWNMSEVRHVIRTVRRAPRSDAVVLVTCLVLTVVFDMVVAVTVGVVLAAFLFMRRMAEVSDVALVGGPRSAAPVPAGEGVLVYEVTGPLFFGAAHKAMSALESVSPGTRVVILDLHAVPAMDATGLVNLESIVERLAADGVRVVLAGVSGHPARVLERARWSEERPGVAVFPGLEEALATV